MEYQYLTSCWVEIDLGALRNNLKEICMNLKDNSCVIMAIVKANAYGHGACTVARTALKYGAFCVGVATPEEGIALREDGIEQPILVLGGILPQQAKLAAQYDLIQTIFTPEALRALDREGQRLGKKVKVHIKIDTGMGRIGVRNGDELNCLLQCIKSCSHIDVEGIYTHFSESDIEDRSYTIRQFQLFNAAVEQVRGAGITPRYLHAANSGAIIGYPEAHFNLVRAGIIMYGYYPSHQVEKRLDLKPVLSWKTKVVHLKTASVGESISYGRTYTTKKPTKIATVRVGYADGYNRLLSNKGYMLVNGAKAPVIGRVCMDQCMLDVTDIDDVQIGDTVTIIGSDGGLEVTADHLADLCDTISYEILTGISSRVPRMIKK
ncbi:MAG: alanine racemase [Clostridia bacterium]|nr:alanine racemase [Clostridia bacterium]